jgi:hypothetical protein
MQRKIKIKGAFELKPIADSYSPTQNGDISYDTT